MKKVMVFGSFDILHKGHLSLFKQARAYGDYLIAVVARDATIKQIKGRDPIYKEQERLAEVQKKVDKAVLGSLKDKYKIIKDHNPDVICLGYDQESFIKGLKKFKAPVKRLKPYLAGIYKSSKLRANFLLPSSR